MTNKIDKHINDLVNKLNNFKDAQWNHNENLENCKKKLN